MSTALVGTEFFQNGSKGESVKHAGGTVNCYAQAAEDKHCQHGGKCHTRYTHYVQVVNHIKDLL